MVTFCELMNNQPPIDVETECQEFNNSIVSVRNILIKSATAVNTYKHLFPRKICERNEFLRQSQELSVISPNTPEIELQQKLFCDSATSIWLHINEECSNILGPIKNATDLINNAQHFLLENRLGKWKRDQVLAGYGDSGAKSSNLHDNNPHLKTALDEIQAQFEDLFECVWTTRILLKAIQDCHDQWQCSDPLEAKLASDITIIQQKLICSSFVVEEQPQVIHFDAKFQATVRLLLPKFVTVDPNISSVSACLLSATQVQRQQEQWAPLNENSGGIAMKMNFGFSILQQNRLICDLRHMKLKNIDRPPKGANESVMDEKFAILFECKLLIKNTPFNIWTTSLPVTVATNVSQDSEGWATITWDSSFFEIGRMPFVVRSEVPWSHMEWA
ncbi:signal transducer and activator of transcription 5A-like, partial [Sitodiplosis mosellana]|uniref:signal transducer and activator of transcription 5A-like n=1 Tax=Sitodiplosis mosellana TaxID=263140 RepID=UPI002444CA1A